MKNKSPFVVFSAGAAVGTLGGLIGLGGAEFRLPLLIGVFGFSALPAIILNKAMSLAVVAAALPFRASSISFADLFSHWQIIVTLLTGSLLGAWLGAGWATKLKTYTLYRVLAFLLVAIDLASLIGHNPSNPTASLLSGIFLSIVGALVGFGIGVIAALMGVAGGKLLIPTIVLLFGVDLKLAGSLSLAFSLPTMIVAFTRYSKDQSFSVIKSEMPFVITMVTGSLTEAYIGSRLLGIIPTTFLLPILAIILLVSAVKVWGHT